MNDVPKGYPESGRQLVAIHETVPALREPYGRVGLYGRLDYEAEPSGLNIREYLRVLYKHKWIIISTGVAFFTLSAVRMLTEIHLFSSTVRVQIEREARVIDGPRVTPESSDDEFMQTQYQILEGRTMAERVASALNLGADPDFVKSRSGFSIVGAVMGLLTPEKD